MEMFKLENTISTLHRNAAIYAEQCGLNVLDKCPFIIEVGALTVGTNAAGKIVLQNVQHPTQFSMYAVGQILQMNFFDGNNEKVIPKMFTRKDWYLDRLKNTMETLELFENYERRIL